MSLQPRPGAEELVYFASLINSQVLSDGLTPVNAHEFVNKLDYHGITMLALQQGSLPAPITALLSNRKALMIATEALKRKAMVEIFDAFANAGLTRSILFKGGALAYTVYQQAWLRPRSDIDILIDQKQHQDFALALETLGYQKQFAIEGDLVSYQQTYSKQLAGQSVMNVDIHWRINNRQTLANSFNVDELVQGSSSLDGVSDNIRIPHTTDSLLIASLHRLGHHAREERLTWLYDIHKLAQTLNHNDWENTHKKAAQKQLAGITLDALNQTKLLFGTAIPMSTIKSLNQAAASKEPSQIFLRRELPEWRYFYADLVALPGIKNKAKLLLENIVPNKQYVLQQMDERSVTKAYLKRAWRGLKRILDRAA